MSAGRMQQEWTKRARSTRSSPVVLGAVGGALVLIVVAAAGGRELEDRLGLRNAVYAVLAAALLIAVCVEALHHRFADHATAADIASARSGAWLLGDPSRTVGATSDTTEIDEPLAHELRLAARLGAELMGETPASRARPGGAPPAAAAAAA